MALKLPPTEPAFRRQSAFRTWRQPDTVRVPRCIGCRWRGERGLKWRPRAIRTLTGWAVGSLLTQTIDMGSSALLPQWQYHSLSDEAFYSPIYGRNSRSIRRHTVLRLTKQWDINRVCMPNGRIYYLVARIAKSHDHFYADPPAATDFRVLALCDAHDWNNHLWTERPANEYNTSFSSLRARIIETRVLPVVGEIPNLKSENRFLGLNGVAALRIMIGESVIRFPLYTNTADDGSRFTADGLTIEQEILKHDQSRSTK